MTNFAINTIAHFLPFVDYFASIGLDWQRIAKEQGLDIVVGGGHDSWLSSNDVLRLLEYLELSRGLKWADPVSRAFDCEMVWPGITERVHGCSHINEVIMIMLEEQSLASSHGYMWLDKEDGKTMLYNASSSKTHPSLNCQIELFRIQLMIRVIRIFMGEEWIPNTILLASHKSPLASDDPLIHVTKIGAQFSAIEIQDLDGDKGFYPKANVELSIVGVVEKLLNNLTGLSALDIDLVARQLGLSRRSLQRLLKNNGTTFKEMRRKASIRKAEYLYEQYPTAPIDDIVHLCGYSAYPNFHRAVVAETGMTPAQLKMSKR